MPDTNPNHEVSIEHDDDSAAPSIFTLRRLLWILAVLIAIFVLTFLPPLVNISRFQRRIASNIGASLGRPVHMDRVSLTLLPFPGFTLENFVVEEDPAFGYEPILRADSVHATLRMNSLWRGRVEFSTISLTDPHVNLVHTANGKWNLDSILLQAARIEAAPTAQKNAGPEPRFPYIEATGARINLKLDAEKTPFSLTDAQFALWLPEPREWHLRLEAHPARTDTAPRDTLGDPGLLRLEGTVGKAASLAEVPIDLLGSWEKAPLGSASRLLLGRDYGIRGEMTFTATVRGTLGQSDLDTHFQIEGARRAEFIPPHPIALEARCHATAESVFHTFSGIECHWPPAESGERSTLIASGAVPDIRQPESASAVITVPALPTSTLLDWLSAATSRPPTALAGTGNLSGTIAFRVPPHGSRQIWSGELMLSGETLNPAALAAASTPDASPIPLAEVDLRTEANVAPPNLVPRTSHLSTLPDTPNALLLLPVTLPLGGKDPAILEGRADTHGYTLHLTGTVLLSALFALGDAIPQFGDGLKEHFNPEHKPVNDTTDPHPTPVHIDLTAARTWGRPQTWTDTPAAPRTSRRSR